MVGYSYFFRQAKSALDIVNGNVATARNDSFRVDYRVPNIFRNRDNFYDKTKDEDGVTYEREHLAPSHNHVESELENVETFLMSNMCPQKLGLNRGRWNILEEAVRTMDRESVVVIGKSHLDSLHFGGFNLGFQDRKSSFQHVIPTSAKTFKSRFSSDIRRKAEPEQLFAIVSHDFRYS